VVDRGPLVGGPALAGHQHQGIFQLYLICKYKNMTQPNIYTKTFRSLKEASKLIAKFGAISIPATLKQLPTGEYVVTFKI